MRPTRLSLLAVFALLAAAATYVSMDALYGGLPPLRYYAPGLLAALAVAEGYAARVIPGRLYGRARSRRPIDPLSVARAVALAKASSVTGALATGAYAGLLGWLGVRFGADVPRDVPVSAAGVVAGIGLVVAALLLERACRVRPPRDGGH